MAQKIQKQKGTSVGPRSEKFKLTLHIIINPKDDGLFVAHCLDFDLITTGSTEAEVSAKMKTVLLDHIRYALKNSLNPFQSAPQKHWKDWWEGIQEKRPEEIKGKRELSTDDNFEVEFQALCYA